MSNHGKPEKHFYLSAGGVLDVLQHRFRGPNSSPFPISIQILIAVLLLWIPLVVLSFFADSLFGDEVAQPFFQDIVPQVRFLIALPILLLADRTIDPVIQTAISKFQKSGVVPEPENSSFEMSLSRLKAARDSKWPDVIIMLLAFGITWLIKPGYGDSSLEAVPSSWLWAVHDGSIQFSAAGWWYLLISGPMFQIALFRWIWRFFIWSLFLYRVSRLSLVMRPSHPDLAGGLGFIGSAQCAFVIIFVAFSAVSASTIANDLIAGTGSLIGVIPEITVLVVLFTANIYTPLVFFSSRLFLARRAKLYEYGALGYKLSAAFDRKWIEGGENKTGPELLSSSDPSAIADYTAAFDNVRSMRPVPTTLRSVLVTFGILVVPFLPLALTVVSLQDLLRRLTESLI